MDLSGDDVEGFSSILDGGIVPVEENESDVVEVVDFDNTLLVYPGDVVAVEDGGGATQLITINLKGDD